MGRWKDHDDQADEDKLQAILHPDTKAKAFKVTVIFGYKSSSKYEEAVDLARRMPTYVEEGDGEWVRHSATYTPEDVEELFRLFSLVHDWDTTEILINHKKVPYAHQLWLPLMWFYRV
jgi:hypothetical protein